MNIDIVGIITVILIGAIIIKVCELEKVSHDDSGLEAVIFTSQGDMRQVGG